MNEFEYLASRHKDDIISGRAIAVVWTIEDVLSVNSDLTEDECVRVLQYIRDTIGPTSGINWSTIYDAIEVTKNWYEDFRTTSPRQIEDAY